MQKPYHTIDKKDTQALARFLTRNGQALLPMVELIEQSPLAVDELIDMPGRASIEAALRLSAEGVAGPPHPGQKGGAVGWHGNEHGTVALAERKLRVRRPRLRKKGVGPEGEVPVPGYEAMQRDGKLGSRMLEILLRGVSTRQYRQVLPEMAETVGVAKSNVSAEAIGASEEELEKLCERRWDDVELLVIYLDGIIFGDHLVLAAVGVEYSENQQRNGTKHVLGIAEGASENQVVAQGLSERLVERGLDPKRRYLFVIDGSKGRRGDRAAIDTVFRAANPVQRCRHHKIENVMGYLLKGLKAQVRAALRAAFRLSATEGKARLEKQAQWLEREHPDAAASLREGLAEMFTVNRLGLSSAVSREAIEASTAQLAALLERRWEEVDLLAIYVDGQQHGEHHVISAVGVDASGKKHVLGIQEGATENAAAAKALLIHLREHGVSPEKKYLFILDGAKGRRGDRAAIDTVFRAANPVQRCRKHKVRNVLDELPKAQHAPVGALMRAAYKLENTEEGMARREKLARFLEHQWPAAAASLREGLEEAFTLNRLGLPPSLHRCLATTNLIESPQSGVSKRTGNVCRWRDGQMVLRWVAGAYLATEKNFRKIQGYPDLWVLAAALGRSKKSSTPQEKVA